MIALDKFGNISFSYNTDGMFRGYADEDGNIKTYIYEGIKKYLNKKMPAESLQAFFYG